MLRPYDFIKFANFAIFFLRKALIEVRPLHKI